MFHILQFCWPFHWYMIELTERITSSAPPSQVISSKEWCSLMQHMQLHCHIFRKPALADPWAYWPGTLCWMTPCSPHVWGDSVFLSLFQSLSTHLSHSDEFPFANFQMLQSNGATETSPILDHPNWWAGCLMQYSCNCYFCRLVFCITRSWARQWWRQAQGSLCCSSHIALRVAIELSHDEAVRISKKTQH